MHFYAATKSNIPAAINYSISILKHYITTNMQKYFTFLFFIAVGRYACIAKYLFLSFKASKMCDWISRRRCF